jgi:GT2 family glycosyltransferase
MMSLFTCIICTRNGARRIGDALDALARLQLPRHWSLEVVVVDNDSDDDTAAVARAHPLGVRLVSEPRRGIAHARLCGWWAAHGDLVAMVDDDNRLAPDYACRAIAHFDADDDLGILGGCGRLPPDRPRPVWFPDFQRVFACGAQGTPDGQVAGDTGHVDGAGMVLRRACGDLAFSHAIERLLITHGEDLEIGLLARAAGWRIRHDPAMRFIHAIEPHRLCEEAVLKLTGNNGLIAPTVWRYRQLLALGRERLLHRSDRYGMAPVVARLIALRHALRSRGSLQERVVSGYLAGVIAGLAKPSALPTIRANLFWLRARAHTSRPVRVLVPTPVPAEITVGELEPV